MTVYPFAFDDDQTLIRIDDNISQLGGQAINQLRDFAFSIEKELGLNPAGSAGSVSNRLSRSLDANGDIKASALSSIGLATLPIVDNQVAASAGIKESKLALTYSTSDLNTKFLAAQAQIDSITSVVSTTSSDLLGHIGGSILLSDGSTSGRHVASNIDLNAVPSDSRDPTFVWAGLLDKDGVPRAATKVADGLAEINNALTTHENLIEDAHPASAIAVDTDNFTEIPIAANTVQKALDAIDDTDRLQIGIHRAVMHDNGVAKTARSQDLILDGYSQNIIPSTEVRAFLIDPPNTVPVDSNTVGDDLIQFIPDNTGFVFDSKFAQVKPGDIITINYGNGIETSFSIESVRFDSDTDWFVRIAGINLFNTDGYTAYARIDRPLFDRNTHGVLAVAAAQDKVISPNIMSSVIVGHPRGAAALGIGFNPGALDSTHYNLYLNLYPTGNPTDRIITMPAIDVTGNAGTTPGEYNIQNIIARTNDALRSGGFNYRFIAFEHNGEFGIMLADPVGSASFSIITGTISGSTLTTGAFINNVVGDATDGKDALGLGASRAALASPEYTASYSSTEAAASLPTKIIAPLRGRNVVVNGVRRDTFAPTFKANADGYWPANVTSRTVVGATTVEVEYTVDMDLCAAELKIGKTIVVQPIVPFDDVRYSDTDYGRFIIKGVSFTAACGAIPGTTVITVINGIHATGSAISASAAPILPVALYFSEDSVSFNEAHVISATAPATVYNRLHEIYFDGEGKTFSHERARMPKQTESTPLLGTTARWTIKDVSPKLRGFLDDATTALNKYVRFVVTRYDSTSGEFDGYIGKRNVSSPTVTKFGPLTTGARKNVPARFYDETGIDYIELEFTNETPSTGDDITPGTVPHYVDIEIFPSIRDNDEYFLLATVEIDNLEAQCVTDRREFGTVSEQNFTNSAIDFIEAGDRFMHANGVLRGLGFVSVDPSNDNVLLFNGGLALVNGHVTPINNGSVAIPEIVDEGVGTPPADGGASQVVTWGICVNRNGQFEPIVLTPSKTQFFALRNTSPAESDYYIPSVTFSELVTKRKDLTLIAVATVTIASVTVDSVEDARKFIIDETASIPLTWVSEDADNSLVGHFHSFEAVKTWVNNYGNLGIGTDIPVAIQNIVIKVKGAHIISEQIDLTELNYPVTFEGDNGSFTITSDNGFILNSNVTFKNIIFNYQPVGGGNDYINSGKGAIYRRVNENEILTNVLIEDCDFNTEIEEIRSPFINIEVDGNSVINNLNINRNTFNDIIVLTDNEFTAAIAIINVNKNGTIAEAAVVMDTNITNNVCNKNQGIHITSQFDSSGDMVGPGIHALGVRIHNNSCGVIGYVVTSDKNINTIALPSVDEDFEKKSRGLSLSIANNSCVLITHTSETGHVWATNSASLNTTLPPLGHVEIKNNGCSWMLLNSVRDQTNLEDSFLLISENNLKSSAAAILENWNAGGGAFASLPNTAIAVTFDVALPIVNTGNVQIINNKISFSTITIAAIDYTVYYDVGISAYTDATITGNIIDGISTGFGTFGGVGIVVGGVITGDFFITNNKIYRRSNNIAAYVEVLGASSNGGFVVDNYFDDYVIDNLSLPASYFTINASGNYDDWIFERNKNQSGLGYLYSSNGNFGVGNITDSKIIAGTDVLSISSGTTIYTSSSQRSIRFAYDNTAASSSLREYVWYIALDDVLPPGVLVGTVTISASCSVAPDIGAIELRLANGDDTNEDLNSDIDFSSGSFYTPDDLLTATLTSSVSRRTGVDAPILQIRCQIQNGANVNVDLGNTINAACIIGYRW